MRAEQLFLAGAPVGVDQAMVVAPVAAAATPGWGAVVATSVVSAAAGWIIEEAVQHVFGRRRRR